MTHVCVKMFPIPMTGQQLLLLNNAMATVAVKQKFAAVADIG